MRILNFDPKTRCYTVELTREENAEGINIVAFGCSGTGEQPQLNVATAIKNFAQDEKRKNTIAIHLGDFSYSDEADINTAMKNHFYDFYAHDGLVYFGVPGNHEGDKDKITSWKTSLFDSAPQIMQAFSENILNYDRGWGQKKFQQFLEHERKEIDKETAVSVSDEIKKLNLPKDKPYYKIEIKTKNEDVSLATIFCLNSSSLVEDIEQQKWLHEELKNSKSQWNLIAAHHPLKTFGKRANDHGDLAAYGFKAEQVIDIFDGKNVVKREISKETSSYNDLFNRALNVVLGNSKEKIDGVISAHDHARYVANIGSVAKPFLQVIAAAGGPEQSMQSPTDEVLFYERPAGCSVTNITHSKLNVEMRDGLNQQRCSYNLKKTDAGKTLAALTWLPDLYSVVKETVAEYYRTFSYAKSGEPGIKRSQDILFIAFNEKDEAMALKKIDTELKSSTELKAIFEDKLAKKYGPEALEKLRGGKNMSTSPSFLTHVWRNISPPLVGDGNKKKQGFLRGSLDSMFKQNSSIHTFSSPVRTNESAIELATPTKPVSNPVSIPDNSKK